MKHRKILLLIVVLTSFIVTSAQTKKFVKDEKSLPLSQLLKGQWYAEDDKNVVLNFKCKKYIEKYGPDTTGNSNYTLSYSCNLGDSVRSNLYKLNKDIYILFYESSEVIQCNELLNLTKDILSWRVNATGKIFVYKKVKKEQGNVP